MPLAIVWPEVGMVAAKLLLSLSILVILHEFGHFITARWFKCRVEKFYLFFDPYFSLFKKKIGETEYGIGWLPLGGYVKIAGMVDESMDVEELSKPPKPDEFRSKPAWQRLIIMLGGVTVNVILAFLISAMILMVWGESHTLNSSLKNGLTFNDSLFNKIGFQNGDKIVAVDGKSVEYFEDIPRKLILGSTATVDRNGKQETIQMPVDFIGQLVEKLKSKVSLIDPRLPIYVFAVPDTGGAFKAGLKPGDKIVSIDSIQTPFYDQLQSELLKKKGQVAIVGVVRSGNSIALKTTISSEGKLGFFPNATESFLDSIGVLKTVSKKYGFFEAFPAGVKMTGDQLVSYTGQMKKIFTPKTGAYKAVGGFKTMANIFPKTEWDWESFWKITAYFSIILAFMNLLPIPALDGGHVLFTLVEMISGRKPNQKFLEYAQMAGMILLLALMLYANGNDWFGWGKGR